MIEDPIAEIVRLRRDLNRVGGEVHALTLVLSVLLQHQREPATLLRDVERMRVAVEARTLPTALPQETIDAVQQTVALLRAHLERHTD